MSSSEKEKKNHGLELSGKTSLRKKGLNISSWTPLIQSQVFDHYIYDRMNNFKKKLMYILF